MCDHYNMNMHKQHFETDNYKGINTVDLQLKVTRTNQITHQVIS